ncbi:MAG: MFS transporter [Qingshengfaniella sp.]
MTRSDTGPGSARDGATLGLMVTLALGAGLGITGMTLIGPSLPSLRADFDISQQGTALLQAGYLLAVALPQLFVGALSDRFGRRRPLLGGLALFILGSLICLIAETAVLFMAGRMIQAIGASAGLVSASALLRERNSETQAAGLIGYLSLGMMVLPMLAPSIGGTIEAAVGWRGNFAFLSGIGGIILLAAARLVHDQPDQTEPTRAGFATLLGSRRFRAYTGQIALASAANHTFLNSTPFLLSTLHGLTPAQYAPLFSIPAASFLIANLLSTRTVARHGINRMITAGTCVTAFSALAGLALIFTGIASGYGALFAIAAAMSFGHGLTIPNAMTGATGAVPGALGRAAGLSGCVQMSVGALAVVVFMPLVNINALPLLLALVGIAVLAALWWGLEPG